MQLPVRGTRAFDSTITRFLLIGAVRFVDGAPTLVSEQINQSPLISRKEVQPRNTRGARDGRGLQQTALISDLWGHDRTPSGLTLFHVVPRVSWGIPRAQAIKGSFHMSFCGPPGRTPHTLGG